MSNYNENRTSKRMSNAYVEPNIENRAIRFLVKENCRILTGNDKSNAHVFKLIGGTVRKLWQKD